MEFRDMVSPASSLNAPSHTFNTAGVYTVTHCRDHGMVLLPTHLLLHDHRFCKTYCILFSTIFCLSWRHSCWIYWLANGSAIFGYDFGILVMAAPSSSTQPAFTSAEIIRLLSPQLLECSDDTYYYNLSKSCLARSALSSSSTLDLWAHKRFLSPTQPQDLTYMAGISVMVPPAHRQINPSHAYTNTGTFSVTLIAPQGSVQIHSTQTKPNHYCSSTYCRFHCFECVSELCTC